MKLWDLIDRTAQTLATKEAPVVDEFDDLDLNELDGTVGQLEELAAAIRHLKAEALRKVGYLLPSPRGFVKLGERVYRQQPDDKQTLKAERRTEFYETVQDSGLVGEVFPHYSVRKGGLRKVADGWVDPETGEIGNWQAFRDHFFDVAEGETKTSVMPWDRAPKFMVQADDGKPEVG